MAARVASARGPTTQVLMANSIVPSPESCKAQLPFIHSTRGPERLKKEQTKDEEQLD